MNTKTYSLTYKDHTFTLGWMHFDLKTRSYEYKTDTQVPYNAFSLKKERAVRVNAFSENGSIHLGICDIDVEMDLEEAKGKLEFLNMRNRYLVMPGFSGKTVKVLFLVKSHGTNKKPILEAIKKVSEGIGQVLGHSIDYAGLNQTCLNRSQFEAVSEWLALNPVLTINKKGKAKKAETKSETGESQSEF